MYRGTAKYFKVVTAPGRRFAVWFADAPLHNPWQDSGCHGPENHCWDFLEACESSDGMWFLFPGPPIGPPNCPD